MWFFSGKFQSKTDCSTVKSERVLTFIVGGKKDDRRVNAQRRARGRSEVESC